MGTMIIAGIIILAFAAMIYGIIIPAVLTLIDIVMEHPYVCIFGIVFACVLYIFALSQ